MCFFKFKGQKKKEKKRDIEIWLVVCIEVWLDICILKFDWCVY